MCMRAAVLAGFGFHRTRLRALMLVAVYDRHTEVHINMRIILKKRSLSVHSQCQVYVLSTNSEFLLDGVVGGIFQFASSVYV